jgi:hypothetical protein
MHLIKRILQGAADAGADVISTPCPLCQQNVEMYQAAVNKQFGTSFNIPVVFYSQLMAVAFGMDAKADAALDRQMIPSAKLAEMAEPKDGDGAARPFPIFRGIPAAPQSRLAPSAWMPALGHTSRAVLGYEMSEFLGVTRAQF